MEIFFRIMTGLGIVGIFTAIGVAILVIELIFTVLGGVINEFWFGTDLNELANFLVGNICLVSILLTLYQIGGSI
jgi:hypothetical protein